MTTVKSTLPDGWVRVPLNEVASHHSGDSKIIKGKLPSSPGDGLYPAYSASGQDVWHDAFNYNGDAIIISAVGARCGKCFKASGKWSAIANTHVVWPNPEAIDRDFLWFKINDENFWVKGGSAQPFVKTRDSFRFELALPPLNEQRRIVEKIETLFARLYKGEEAVREVQKLLTRYRQSVLKSAVTGQLVESDRSGWEALELGSLIEDIRYGTAKKCGYEEANTAVLRIPNVVGGIVDLDDLKYTDLTEKELDKLALQKGDVLIVRSNGSANLVARGAVVEGDAVGMAYAGYLIRLRVDQARILPEYLHLSLNSPQTRQIIERQARSTSGVHNINSGEVKAIAVELPPIDEQRKIMAAVDDALQKIVDLERWCETELKRSASLRQSILKDAFAGRLIPQDPNDEPASALLARIATEKAPTKKTRRKASA